MRATVTTELYGPDNRLLRKNSQPSRSLTFGFIRPMFTLFRNVAWSVATWGTKYCYNMASPPAEGQVSMADGNYPYAGTSAYEFYGSGMAWGIQISGDTAAVTPRDTWLRQRIGPRRGVEAYCLTGITGSSAAPRQYCRGLASDRQQHLWVIRTALIARLGLVPGSLGMSYEVEFAAPNARAAYGLTYDGTWLWSGNPTDNLIHCIDPTTGAVQFQWATPGGSQSGLAWDFDLNKIYSYDSATGLIYRHTPATGAVEDSFNTGITLARDIEWKDGYIYFPDDLTMRVFNPATGLEVADWYLPVSSHFVVFVGPYWITSPMVAASIQYGQFYAMLDYSDTEVPELMVGGCEVYPVAIAHPNGSFVVRRNFRNLSAAGFDVNKVGIYSGEPQECLASDLLAVPVTVGVGEELVVTYTFQITV